MRGARLRQESRKPRPPRPVAVVKPPPKPLPLIATPAPQPAPPRPSPPAYYGSKAVRAAAASLCGMAVVDFLRDDRRQPAVLYRQAAMYVARKAGPSLPQIGRVFGRDHTTVLHAVRNVEAEINGGNAHVIAIIGAIRSVLNGEPPPPELMVKLKPDTAYRKPRQGTRWSRGEVEILTVMYRDEGRSMLETAIALRRTPNAVAKKALALGIAANKLGPRRRIAP